MVPARQHGNFGNSYPKKGFQNSELVPGPARTYQTPGTGLPKASRPYGPSSTPDPYFLYSKRRREIENWG